MSSTPVYIISSPVPQVGKTLLARLLSEFILLKDGDVEAFDVNVREPSLVDYLPSITETANVNDTYGKMRLMDRVVVDDGLAKVIDLGFHAFEDFFKMTEEICLLQEATYRNVTPIILFLADTNRISVRAYESLREQFPPENLIAVQNEHVVRTQLPPTMTTAKVLQLRALSGFLKTYIDHLTFSFTAYLRLEKDTSTELYQWIQRVYLNLRELDFGGGEGGTSTPTAHD